MDLVRSRAPRARHRPWSLLASLLWVAACGAQGPEPGAEHGDGTGAEGRGDGAQVVGKQVVGKQVVGKQVVGKQGTEDGQLVRPRALAVDPASGSFHVVDRSGRVQWFDRHGSLLASWRLPATELGQPTGLALEAEGTLLVSDTHYQRVRRYPADGRREIAAWGAKGTGPGQLTFGRDVAVDSAGCVYVGDYGSLNDRIQKYTRDGAFILEWGRRGREPGQFDRPQGMAIERRDGRELLLVADCNNHRIQRFSLDGGLVSVWGTPGTGPGCLRFPMSVAVGPGGYIYVVEWGNNRVQRFTPDGQSLGTVGRAGRAPGEFLTPWDVALDDAGRLYVADYGNHRVQIITVTWPVAVTGASGE